MVTGRNVDMRRKEFMGVNKESLVRIREGVQETHQMKPVSDNGFGFLNTLFFCVGLVV